MLASCAMTGPFVLDAWAVLAFLQDEAPAAGRVQAVLDQAATGTVRLAMSVVNLGEVYYTVGRAKGREAARETLADLQQLPIDLVDADRGRAMAAAELKMAHALSYADAFAASTALELGGRVLTGDPELLGLEEVVPLDRLSRGDGDD